MKSPPVEDMFAELESEDGDDHVLPRRSKSKIYYSRDELLALKDSPLVKVPDGMSPASEWFSASSNDASVGGHRSRQPQFMGDSIKDFSLAPTKGIKRGLNRGLADHEDAERPFGRGLVSSGRPRNLARRTDSATSGRAFVSGEEMTDQPTPERTRTERGDRNDRKERTWLRSESKEQPEGESTLMGRFAVKGALKLQTGEEVEKRPFRAADAREARDSRFSDTTPRRIAESTWRRTTSGNVERAPPVNTRRYGAHDEEHVPEWMMDENPNGPGVQASEHSAITVSAQSGLDEIAAYRQAMKEREELLNSASNDAGRMPSRSNADEGGPPGLFSELSTGRSRNTTAAQKAHAASFLLPQAKAKNRVESVDAAVADPVTPAGKGSRFARFFDPSASPATLNSEPSGLPIVHPNTHLPATPGPTDSIADQTQGLAALLGIKPTSLNRGDDTRPIHPHMQSVPVNSLSLPPLQQKIPDSRPALGAVDSSSQSVDHMARLLGMLKTASAQPPLPASHPPAPSTPTRDMRSPGSANLSPNSGSRFLAAMLNGEKVKPNVSPQAQSAQPIHSINMPFHQSLGPPSGGPGSAQHSHLPSHGAPPADQRSHRNLDVPPASARPIPVENHSYPHMTSPIASDMMHARPPNMEILPMLAQLPHHGQQRPMPRPHGAAESTPAIQQQTQFWQLAGDLPRGMIPNHPMHMPGPPFSPVNMPPPPGYGPYQHQQFMPNISQMPPPPMMFNGGHPPGPPPQSMAPDAMSSNLMALLQNRPQA